MELFTLGLFCFLLLFCILLDFSILYALAGGLLLFLLYGKRKGYRWRELISMSLSGVKKVKNILLTFVLIGILTALWRDAGTIPTIVCFAARLIRPSVFLLMAFLLNCLVSVLTGTAFGTAATMGVICTAIASALHIDPLLAGGAVLSGAYFGDRCSPVSTSALLVSELTGTNIFGNIKNMLRSACVPFLLSCALYFVIGFFSDHFGQIPDLQAIFGDTFVLNWIAILPAAVILLLSLLRVDVKIAMAASILTAIPICLFQQHTPVAELPGVMLLGFSAESEAVAAMLDGGGILSMAKVAAIVCLSSSYSGIFQKTGLLDSVRQGITKLSQRTTPHFAIFATSVISGMIACNQTLTIMLTHQLCSRIDDSDERLALHLEDTAVVVAPLIPWSIASAVPVASIGCPAGCVLLAFFLYLIPIWNIFVEMKGNADRYRPQAAGSINN